MLRETYQIEQNGNALVELLVRHAIEPTVHFEKFCRRQPIIEAEMFGKKTNFAACLEVSDRAAKNLGFSACGEYQAQQHFHRSALTCAVWSQEPKDLTPRNIEGEVSDCHLAAEDFAKPTGTDGQVRRSDHLHLSTDQRNEAARPKASDELP